MKKYNKSGFTITELILTTVIMVVVLIITPMVTLKRMVKAPTVKKFDEIAKCTDKCIYDAKSSLLKTSSSEEVRLDYNKNSNEFYVIEIIGGGGGSSGETKTMFLPSLDDNLGITNDKLTDTSIYGGILTGYYLMEVNGGVTNSYGGASRFCIISEAEAAGSPTALTCDGKIVIAEAGGSGAGGMIIIK